MKVITITCDRCGGDATFTEHLSLSVDGVGTKSADLCWKCSKEMFESLKAIFERKP